MNYYKVRSINRLVKQTGLNVVCIEGRMNTKKGHKPEKTDILFEKRSVPVFKSAFGYSPRVFITILKELLNYKYDYLVSPPEYKFIFLNILIFLFKVIFRFKLVAYTHPPKIKNRALSKWVCYQIDKISYKLYDIVVFYTKGSMEVAIKGGYIKKEKAFYANNTLDTELIWSNYQFEINASHDKVLLFIGRLIPNKRLEDLFKYFHRIKGRIGGLKLIIIGDGPENYIVKKHLDEEGVSWLGGMTKEEEISKIMKKVHAVFIPGHTGLAIVHAFCYGKPFVASADYQNHPPEIEYLRDGYNGIILNSSFEDNVERMATFLSNQNDYELFCKRAFKTAKELSILNWCLQMKNAMFQLTD